MSARDKTTRFVCQDCGSVYKKWSGRCEECNAWNTIIEEKIVASSPRAASMLAKGNKLEFVSLQDDIKPTPRILSGIEEFDRVMGGGLVRGSGILIGGDPGIGKSTLLLQLAGILSDKKVSVAYITGEESTDQIRLRAARLGLTKSSVALLSATSVNDIIPTITQNPQLELLIIDSIQTMFLNDFDSAPGTVSQVRASAHELINLAKTLGVIVILVGHVTKDGQIAGPKLLEHMVDTVLYFEGERGHHYRILRSVKNRYGGVNEIGVFEMTDKGLSEINNPSALFLPERERNISGSAVFAGVEGTRPVLVEVQALISPSFMAAPRRAVVGWDMNRLAMIIAVLSVRYGVNLSDKEVYLSVAGGLKITEPAADLAIACALLSSISGVPLPSGTIIFGEVGLSGEIRNVSHAEIRLKEAAKLGFTNAIIPKGSKFSKVSNLAITEIMHIKQLKDIFSKKS